MLFHKSVSMVDYVRVVLCTVRVVIRDGVPGKVLRPAESLCPAALGLAWAPVFNRTYKRASKNDVRRSGYIRVRLGPCL